MLMITSEKKPLSKPSESRADLDFYPRLVGFLNPIFNISESNCQLLNHASSDYFQALIIIDQAREPKEMIEAIGRIEKAIRHLSAMFEDNHAFWTNFQRNKETYFTTLKIEQEYSSTRRKLTEDDFDKIAIGKSSVCYSILDAMSYLSSYSINKDDILILLKEIHIAFQCKDDIDDFRIDLNEGQHTYSHVLTLTELSDIKISQKEFSNDLIHRYFYVSGIAKRCS